ncbi:hypothetical protein [Cupriavidus sp. 2SB]|uniref:hypothetical protein n=1 Tax=Cupriavidus sp. 2SB TaxID=2502199 RepID=UPI0010F718CC|nr:hypothetical protein [Cupriavidus sp. 2SB]
MAELLLGAIGWIFVELIVSTVFYGIGWVVISIVTFGMHPGPWRGLENLVGVQLVAFVGLLTTVVTIASYFTFVR